MREHLTLRLACLSGVSLLRPQSHDTHGNTQIKFGGDWWVMGKLASSRWRIRPLLNSPRCTVPPNNNKASGSRHQESGEEEVLGLVMRNPI